MVKTDEKKKAAPLTREQICEYIWTRYIDLGRAKREIDEEAALQFFEEYYSKHPLNTDEECFYYGILLYERAFSDEANRDRFLVKAKEVLETYREQTGETEWEAIELRYEDVCDMVESENLLEKVKSVAELAPPIEGMVLVPAGPFPFGIEGKQITLEPFYIDVYPVTNAEYRRFTEDTGYRTPPLWERKPDMAADDLPVTGISWMDCLQYCKWAGKSLPTAEQWEKAARGEQGNKYPWGDQDPTPDLANFYVVGDEPRLRSPQEYPKNESPFGVMGMAGHIWEWTNTPYPEIEGHHYVKGGSWVDPPAELYLAASAENWASKKEKNDVIGFRCTKRLEV